MHNFIKNNFQFLFLVFVSVIAYTVSLYAGIFEEIPLLQIEVSLRRGIYPLWSVVGILSVLLFGVSIKNIYQNISVCLFLIIIIGLFIGLTLVLFLPKI